MSDGDHFLDVGDARLRYRAVGAGPTVVLVHGWALDLDMWRPQFAALADSYRLIAFDRRGFGLSSGTPDLQCDVDDLVALLAALDTECISIAGMSQGARVALSWAWQFPDRTRCMVLDGPPRVGTSTLLIGGDEIPIAAWRELIAREGLDAFRKHWLQHDFMRLHSGLPQSQALLGEMIARYPGHDLRSTEDLRAPAIDATGIDVPALVISGEHDTAARRAAAAELARSLPHAHHRVIANAGHLCNLDNPQAYNSLLREFLRLRAHDAGHCASPSSEYTTCSTG